MGVPIRNANKGKQMSTRATYEFNLGDKTTYCYRHHDGYPEGAAEWLKGVRTAEDFIRKNEGVEITASHDVHGDTEYRYKITAHREGETIWVQKRLNDHHWEVIFCGSADLFQEYYGCGGSKIGINLN